MLDGLLKWAVDYLLKDYVIIDPNAAKTDILSGKIEFENLELRPDLLEKLGVPGYSLRAGYIQKLLVHISPFNYATQPANVTIDGVYLLLVPSHIIKVDKKTKTQRKVDDKLRTLAKIEDMRAKKLESDAADPSQREQEQNKKDGFLLRQVMAIVRNLQISISNIHIRLEDSTTDPNCKVSLGLSLESLTLSTCNKEWQERLVTESSDVFYKIAKLRSLAFYFTTDSPMYSEQQTGIKFEAVLKKTIAKEGDTLPKNFEYLVKPLSSDARVWVVPNPRRCQKGQPQIYLDMVVHNVAIQATKAQVHSSIALAESADLLRMKNKYKKFRPKDFTSPKTKWKFAIECILVKTVRPKLDVWKWDYLKDHFGTCRDYKSLMVKLYTNPNHKLTEIETATKRYAEEKLDVFNLDLCRRRAQQEVKLTKEALAREQKKKKQAGGGGWFGWGSKKTEKVETESEFSVENELEKGMNDSQNREELYKALGFDDSEDGGVVNYSLLPKDFIQMEVGVALKKFSIALAEDVGAGVLNNVCKISMYNFKTSLTRQPTPNYLKAKFDLGRLDIDGCLAINEDPKTTKPPQLLSMIDQNSKSSLVTLVFELNPISNSEVDYAIHVRSQSVQMTYDYATVQSLVDFFRTKEEATLVADDVKDAASRQMKKLNNTSTAGVLFLLENHKVISLDVDLEPSFALIPAKGKITSDTALVIFKTGKLKVVTKNSKSALRVAAKETTAAVAAAATDTKAHKLAKTSTFDEVKDKPYDNYECTLSNVQLFYMQKSDNWQQVALNPDSSDSLVKPIQLTMDIQKCMVTDDPEFPVIKVSANLEKLVVTISDLKMIYLMMFLKEMKYPKSGSTVDSVKPPANAQYVPIRRSKEVDTFELDKLDSLLPLVEEVGEKKKETGSLQQLTLAKLKFKIETLAVLLLEDSNPDDKLSGSTSNMKPLLSAELNNLSVGVLKKNYEALITIGLKSISIAHEQFKHGSENLRLLETKLAKSDNPKEERFVAIDFLMAERSSPVFHTQYDSVEFKVNARFQGVAIRVHLEAILSAMEFQKSLFDRLFPNDDDDKLPIKGSDLPSKSAPVDNERLSLDTALGRVDEYNKMLSRERKTKLIQLQLWASMNEIDFVVSSIKMKHDITTMRLEGMQSFLEVVPSETITFSASMEYFDIKDPVHTTLYPHIFSVVGSKVFSLKLVYYFAATNGDGYRNMDNCDLSLELSTGTPRIVYIHRWVDSIIQFANNFQEAQDSLMSAGSTAAKNAADLAQTAHKKAFRIKLDLDILAPSLIIPQNSNCDHVLYANLGHLNISNHFTKKDLSIGIAILDSLTLKLKDVKVSRAILGKTGDVVAECHLLEPSLMQIDLIRNLTPNLYKEQSGFEISGNIVSLHTSLGQADIQLAYEIVFGNFGEVKPKKNEIKKKSSSMVRLNSRQGRSSYRSSRSNSIHSGAGDDQGRTVSPKPVSPEETTEKLTSLKASFKIESVSAQLYSDRITLSKGLEKRDANASLGKFELLALNVFMTTYSDGNMFFKADMMDCTLDDTRTSSNGGIVRMIERKKNKHTGFEEVNRGRRLSDDTECADDLYMFVVDYEKDQHEQRVNINLNDMYICVCTDFLMSIGDFFLKNKPTPPKAEDEEKALTEAEKALTAPLKTITEEDAEPEMLTVAQNQTQAEIEVPETEKKDAGMTTVLAISFRNPEIVLVSETKNDYSPCLILTWKVRSSVVLRPNELKLTALINDVELICCPFKTALRQGNTKQVIPKFNLQAFANQSESSKQQNMNIDIDELDINISPAVIKIMQAVATAMSAHQSIDESNEVYGVNDMLWAPKVIEEADIAFLKVPVVSKSKATSVDVVKSDVNISVETSESAFLNAPRILVKFDVSDSTGITQPILLIESSLTARVNNYVSRESLQIVADISLGMTYYNDLVNAWEPVIEPNKFINEKTGKMKAELWTLKTEVAHNGTDSTSNEELESAEWSVVVSSQKSLEMTVTSRFLYITNLIQEAFSDSMQFVASDASVNSFGDVAPYAVVNETGRELSILIPQEFLVVGRSEPDSPDDCNLIHLNPTDKVELLPNSNLPPAKFRRMTAPRGSFINSVTDSQRERHDDGSLQLKFQLIIPGSQNINDVSLTKPGSHFYNILPLDKNKFSLVVHNGLNETGHQNVCTISSPLILTNHFDIAFDVFHNKIHIGTINPGKNYHVPMVEAFFPLESNLFIRPKPADGTPPQWDFCKESIDWKLIKKNGGARRVVHKECPPNKALPQAAKMKPLQMILQLESIKFGTIHGQLQDTPHHIIHIKPTCILRNLSPYPIYHRIKPSEDLKNAVPYKMLTYGQQEVINEVVIDTTKIDIDVTDQNDKRYLGMITIRKQDKPITHGQWFDARKESSLVMAISWEYDDSDFLIMSIFAPYWIVNRLDRDLYIKRADSDKVVTHPRNFSGITLFASSTKENVEKVKMCVRVDNTLFSEPLNIQAVGNAEVAVCPRRSGGDLLVGVTNTLSRLQLSKIIVLTPNYILLNNTKYVLEYAQYIPNQSDPLSWSTLSESGVVGIWPAIQDSNSDNKRKIYLMLKYDNNTTKPFFISRPDEFLVRVAKIGCLHVSVSVSESATTITINTYFPGAAPVKLFNLTDKQILYWQNSEDNKESVKTYVLSPGTHILFTWPDPTAPRLFSYKFDGQVYGKNDKDKCFDLKKDDSTKITCAEMVGDQTVHRTFYATTMLCRQQRVVIFTDDECLATGTKVVYQEQQLHENFSQDVTLNLYGVGLSLINNTINKELPKEIMYVGVTPTDVTWMYYGKGKKHWTFFSVNNISKIEAVYQSWVDLVGRNDPKAANVVTVNLSGVDHTFDFNAKPIKLVAPDLRKIKRTYLHGIYMRYQQSPNVTHFHFKMNRLQIDDPLPTCLFPVVFAPVPPPKSIVGDKEPIAFIETSIVMQRGSGQLILFKYAKVLIQEFSIKIDTTFLGALQMFFKGNEIIIDVKKYLEEDVKLAHTQLSDTEAVQVARGTQRHYYQDLNFGPIKMLLSLSLSRGADNTGLQIDNSVVDVLAQSLGVALTEQHDTCFKMAYFERKNCFMTYKQLTNQAQKFYTNQIVRQFYFLFANLDAMGNPQKLFLGLKEGGTDLFYEPYQGAILGPAEFVEGLGIGVRSLGSGVVGGVFGVASSVTASAGQAIAFLSFDEKHKQERRTDMRDKPQHLGQGLTKGFKRFGSGVVGGVTGVITQPLQGAKKDGAKGLVTGLGKGAAGLVAKPVGGVVDLASNTFEGIRGSADDAVFIGLLRTPRVVRSDLVVRPYDSYEAEGNAILASLQKQNHRYSAHVFTNKSCKTVIIVTHRAILHAEKKALVTAFEKWDTLTMYLFRDVISFPQNNLDDEKFQIEMKGEKDKNAISVKVISVQAAYKQFLRQRAIETLEEFRKTRASND